MNLPLKMNYINLDRERRVLACYPCRAIDASVEAHVEYIDVNLNELDGPVRVVVACQSVPAKSLFKLRVVVNVLKMLKTRLGEKKILSITLAAPSMAARWMSSALQTLVALPEGCTYHEEAHNKDL